MNFDKDAVVAQMLQSASRSLHSYWKTARPIASTEFANIADLVEQIGEQRLEETITPEDARDRLDMLKLATIAALNTQAGISEIAAEDAINLALGSVSSIINAHLGFALI